MNIPFHGWPNSITKNMLETVAPAFLGQVWSVMEFVIKIKQIVAVKCHLCCVHISLNRWLSYGPRHVSLCLQIILHWFALLSIYQHNAHPCMALTRVRFTLLLHNVKCTLNQYEIHGFYALCEWPYSQEYSSIQTWSWKLWGFLGLKLITMNDHFL